MTSDDRLVRTHSRLSGWQLVGAAYRLLRDHGREAVNIATVPTLIAILSSLMFSWIATGGFVWDTWPAGFDSGTALGMILFGAAYLWISGLIFDRWTRHLLGTKKPVRPERPTFWSSWVLGCLVLGVGFAVIVAIVGIVLAPTGSVLFALIVSMPLAWVLSNLAAARLLLKASLRASFLTTRPVLSEFVLQDWSRSGWAYAIAPLPFLLGSILLGKLADAVGGWVSVGWHLVEPLNGTISTLLIAAIGVVSIRSSMAGAVYDETSPDLV